ncbi:MAG: enoyl-CoA hydratase [Beijerinckiaceae bacterium]
MTNETRAASADGPDVITERAEGVLRLTLNRPRTRNAMTYGMYEAVGEACRAAADDAAIHAIIITGQPSAFAAGTDIALFRDVKTPADALAYEERIETVLRQIEDCHKPTIAAIAGACTGGGAALAAVCDLRIGSSDARIGFPIARTLGNCLSIANYARLTALVGEGRVKEMVLTARLYDADEAWSAGFLHEVHPDAEAALARAHELAAAMAGHAPLTMASTKAALNRLRRAHISTLAGDDLVTQAYCSDDFREGVDAFLAKRAPVWTGR